MSAISRPEKQGIGNGKKRHLRLLTEGITPCVVSDLWVKCLVEEWLPSLNAAGRYGHWWVRYRCIKGVLLTYKLITGWAEDEVSFLIEIV